MNPLDQAEESISVIQRSAAAALGHLSDLRERVGELATVEAVDKIATLTDLERARADVRLLAAALRPFARAAAALESSDLAQPVPVRVTHLRDAWMALETVRERGGAL